MVKENNIRKISNKIKQKVKLNRKTGMMILFVLFILGGIFFAIFSKTSESQQEKVIVYINKEPITEEELLAHMSFCKGQVSADLKKKYDITLNQSSYDQKAGKVTALDYWKEQAFSDLVRYKTEQQLAVKYGVLDEKETTYAMFLENMEQENKERADKVAEGKVVYGAKKYTLQSYYRYVYSNMQLQLIDVISIKGDVFNATEEQLKKYYEKNKKDYKAVDIYRFSEYFLSETAGDEEIQKIYQLLNGEKRDTIDWSLYSVEKHEVEIHEDNYLEMSKASYTLYDQAVKMKEGEISDLIDTEQGRVILVCESRKNGGYRSFEKYREEVEQNWKVEAYESYVDGLTKDTKVKKTKEWKRVEP